MNARLNPFKQMTVCHSLAFVILAMSLIQLTISLHEIWNFTTDDAYISWRYAQSLVEGQGLRWNFGRTLVEGYSNFSWVLLAALALKFGLPLVATMKLFSCASLFGALFCLYQLSRIFLPPLPSVLPIFIFSQDPGVVWWTVSGLETSFYVAMAVWTCWQTLRALGYSKLETAQHAGNLLFKPPAEISTAPLKLTVRPSFHWTLACLGLLILALTRFEGILWAFVIVLTLICFKFSRQSPPSADGPQAVLGNYQSRFFILLGLLFVLPYALYFLWRIRYFGQLIPNSYLCKHSTASHHFYLVKVYLRTALPCFLLGLPYLLSKKDCRHLLLWLPSLIYMGLLWQANPVIAHYNRLFLAPWSLLTLLPVLGIQKFFDYVQFSTKQNQFANTAVIFMLVLFGIPHLSVGQRAAAVTHYQQRSEMRQQVAAFLNQHAKSGDRIVLADNGIIPFESRNDLIFIDSECLTNPEMAGHSDSASLARYAQHLKHTIQPEWIISTYYPHLGRGNRLDEQLNAIGFFNRYTERLRLKSHRFAYQDGKVIRLEPDFSYLIYAIQRH